MNFAYAYVHRRLQAKCLQRLLPIREQDIATRKDNRLLREDEHTRFKYCNKQPPRNNLIHISREKNLYHTHYTHHGIYMFDKCLSFAMSYIEYSDTDSIMLS